MTESFPKQNRQPNMASKVSLAMRLPAVFVSRGERIRTSDLVDPNDARYRAALRPVTNKKQYTPGPTNHKIWPFSNSDPIHSLK